MIRIFLPTFLLYFGRPVGSANFFARSRAKIQMTIAARISFFNFSSLLSGSSLEASPDIPLIFGIEFEPEFEISEVM